MFTISTQMKYLISSSYDSFQLWTKLITETQTDNLLNFMKRTESDW